MSQNCLGRWNGKCKGPVWGRTLLSVSKEEQRGQCGCSKWTRERVPESKVRKLKLWRRMGVGQILLDLYSINSLDEHFPSLRRHFGGPWGLLQSFCHGRGFMRGTGDKRMKEWPSTPMGQTHGGTAELPQICHLSSLMAGQALRGGAVLVYHAVEMSSCSSLLRNGRNFQHGCSFFLHLGEKAKLLLEVVASWPRGQWHLNSSITCPLSFPFMLSIISLGVTHVSMALWGVTVSQEGKSSSRADSVLTNCEPCCPLLRSSKPHG